MCGGEERGERGCPRQLRDERKIHDKFNLFTMRNNKNRRKCQLHSITNYKEMKQYNESVHYLNNCQLVSIFGRAPNPSYQN